MTDYDPVRTCCSGADICRKCWTFMTVSIKILDRVLRQEFGFVHLLWVYSGRRGVHCWVCDDKARALTPEARRAIVTYLEVVKGGENVTKKVNLYYPLYPSLAKSLKVLEPHFHHTILGEMESLRTPELWGNFLALVPDEEVKVTLSKAWTANPTLSSPKKWEQLCQELSYRKRPTCAHTPQDIMFQYMYPRLDVNVSIGLNHLLKAPFCVHPKTGRVCIPIDPARCEEFDPFTGVPLLSDLIAELNANGPEGIPAAGSGRGGFRVCVLIHDPMRMLLTIPPHSRLPGRTDAQTTSGPACDRTLRTSRPSSRPSPSRSTRRGVNGGTRRICPFNRSGRMTRGAGRGRGADGHAPPPCGWRCPGVYRGRCAAQRKEGINEEAGKSAEEGNTTTRMPRPTTRATGGGRCWGGSGLRHCRLGVAQAAQKSRKKAGGLDALQGRGGERPQGDGAGVGRCPGRGPARPSPLRHRQLGGLLLLLPKQQHGRSSKQGGQGAIRRQQTAGSRGPLPALPGRCSRGRQPEARSPRRRGGRTCLTLRNQGAG
jgi:predicted DNA primase small subunit